MIIISLLFLLALLLLLNSWELKSNEIELFKEFLATFGAHLTSWLLLGANSTACDQRISITAERPSDFATTSWLHNNNTTTIWRRQFGSNWRPHTANKHTNTASFMGAQQGKNFTHFQLGASLRKSDAHFRRNKEIVSFHLFRAT